MSNHFSPAQNQCNRQLIAICSAGLFFLLFFVLIPCSIFYNPADITLRCLVYLFISGVAGTMGYLNRRLLWDRALIIDHKHNHCQFSSGGTAYQVYQLPLSELSKVQLVQRVQQTDVEMAYGVTQSKPVVQRQLLLCWHDGREIAWEGWGTRPETYMKSLERQINRAITTPSAAATRFDFYDYKNSERVGLLIALIYLLLAIFHR